MFNFMVLMFCIRNTDYTLSAALIPVGNADTTKKQQLHPPLLSLFSFPLFYPSSLPSSIASSAHQIAENDFILHSVSPQLASFFVLNLFNIDFNNFP